MSLIECPTCGEKISDKAKKCIHCGEIFIKEEIVKKEIKCVECGATLSETDKTCPNCGCPVEESNTMANQKSKKTNNKAKGQMLLTISIVSAISSFIMWFWEISHDVAISESESNYIVLGYMNSTLFISRVITIALPISIFICVVFFILFIIKRNQSQ